MFHSGDTPQILVVEDEKLQREILSQFLKKKGYSVREAETAFEALKAVEEHTPDVIILDWKLPDDDGISLIPKLKDKAPLTPIIMLTAFATVERAVKALKSGAYHYLTKPVELEELSLIVEHALSELSLRREVEELRKKLSETQGIVSGDFIAESRVMKRVLSLVAKVAPTDATVLLTGESGTGKEVLARLIHTLSGRKNAPFVSVNCAAIPEGLLEAELFGYEKGAFTGAVKSKPGLFEEAKGGTIFLDEIAELPLPLQAKLLRVLQDGTFRRVGGTKELKTDARIIAATNRDLKEMINEGSFREDLYWRLNVFNIHIPSLRERKEDIIPLAHHFLKSFARKYGKSVKEFSRDAVEFLLTYPFPGNVRELENMIERAVILSQGEIITVEDLKLPEIEHESFKDALFTLPLTEAVELLEKIRIEKALKEAKGVKSKAAELLGISERVLRYKIQKYQLIPPSD